MYRCSFALVAVACSVSSAGTVVRVTPRVDAVVVSGPVDSDGDGLSDLDEGAVGSDPALADSDHDGLDDGVEAALLTDPTGVDSDGDGFTDAEEVEAYRDPLDATSVARDWPYTDGRGAVAGGNADGC